MGRKKGLFFFFTWRNPKVGIPDVLWDLPREEIGLGRPWGSTQGIGNFPMDSSPEFPFPAGIREGKRGILVTTFLTLELPRIVPAPGWAQDR